MHRPVLFIADLHLDPARPEATRAFLHFLEHRAPDAQHLYILGDLFEAWVGDDAVSGDEPELQALRTLTASGTPVSVMHGNRDFLLGARFAQLTGVRLIPDPTVVEIHGTRTVLLHGDSLCTDDTDYQAFRAMVRDPAWQAGFLSLPLPERIEQARSARAESTARGQDKDPALMDVTPDAVHRALTDAGTPWMIHGHTHKPAVHRYTHQGHDGARFVLGDWYEQGSVLRCDPDKWALETLVYER